jgi:hypothetical protein
VISERLAALDASIHAVPAEDDEYAELVLEIERGSRPFSVAGAEAARSLMEVLPALVALVAAAEDSLPATKYAEEVWQSGGLASPYKPLRDALAALDKALA